MHESYYALNTIIAIRRKNGEFNPRDCVFVLFVLVVNETLATTYSKILTNRELALEAGTIVIGRCTDLRSTWMGRRLYTIATITASETLKGARSEAVKVVIPGGADMKRKVPIAMTVDGAPRILPNEEVFLFLDRSSVMEGGYRIVGFAQGKFSIVEGPDGGKTVTGGIRAVSQPKGASATNKGAGGVSLDRFKQEIMGYLLEDGIQGK